MKIKITKAELEKGIVLRKGKKTFHRFVLWNFGWLFTYNGYTNKVTLHEGVVSVF